MRGTPRDANSLSPVPSAARPSRTALRMLFSFNPRSRTPALPAFPSLHLDPGLLHDLPPFRGVFADELSQLFGRTRARLGALGGEALLEGGRGERLQERGVESLNDVRWRR